MERVRAMIAPPSYLYEVSSARAPEGFHSVKEEPQRKDFQVDFPFENPTGYKKPTVRSEEVEKTKIGSISSNPIRQHFIPPPGKPSLGWSLGR